MRKHLLERFAKSTGGAIAVEFAWVAPVVMALVFGGYSVAQSVTISRKVTLTARGLADLTTQFTSLSATDMSTVLNASSQIIAPFNATSLSLRISEIQTDSTGLLPTVAWSASQNIAPYATGAPFTLPVSMLQPSMSYILGEVVYAYTPLYAITPATVTISDHLFMMPRLSSSISYSG